METYYIEQRINKKGQKYYYGVIDFVDDNGNIKKLWSGRVSKKEWNWTFEVSQKRIINRTETTVLIEN